MTTIAAKHAAAALRNVLKVEFPGVKFYVRSDSCSISVGWTDGPDRDAVQEFCYPFKGSNWDGFNSEYVPTGFTLTVTIDGKEVTGSPLVDHLSLSRTFSPEVTAEAEALWSAQFDGADPKTSGGMRGSFRVKGQWIDDNWAAQQVHQIAQEVVAPRRWAEAKAAPAPARAPRKPRKTAEPAAARPARKERKERKPRPSGHTITVSYLPEVGLTVTGTRMRDGAGPVLRGLGFTWEGAPAKRWELHTPDASQAPAVTAALTAAGLTAVHTA
ncbi:LPD29 domain-containing protein [Streptomyces sp. G1]|uniref:LPD29 domain-containing protein n=1 Tax=Streptomyces sp. G1 TaxID=361572 RepID=UPI00202E9E5C|nr:LPD29 domain-containing protein [Streptomyces sp. G1]MCM1964867.1 hypothetical protein [Streptomyces sp. G1]